MKIGMKKAIGIVFAVVLLIAALAGCGSNSSSTPPAQDNTAKAETPAAPETPAPAPETPAASALSGNIKTGGSTSVEKVMNALIYQFQAENPEVTIDYELNGSGDGIKNTISGLYEIGHSSRELKSDGSEDGLTATAYAIDGIAIIVHKDNGVAELSKDQIKGIYTGKIANWKEVGGSDAAITVVTREEGSGTRSGVADIIGLEKKDDPATAIVASATVANDTGSVQTTVAANPNAIGYVSFSDADTSKINTVAYEGVPISVETVKDKSYKLQREFFVLTKDGETLSPAAQAFIDFILSADGQKIVAEKNLLPVK